MTRVPLLLLSLLAAGGLAPAALAKENNKPPAGTQPAQFGNQPGLNGGDMHRTQPVDRVTGDVQEGTGIRHRQQPDRTGQSPVNGQIQQGTGIQRPGNGQTQFQGDVQEGTGIRRRQQPTRTVQSPGGEQQIIGEVQEGTGIRHRQRTGQSPVGGQVQQGATVERPRDRPRRRRR